MTSRADAHADRQRRLTRLALLSVAAAVVTIALKTGAWLLTDSVGLLSDALESVVNLVGAVTALLVVRWASRPPDEEHPHGHDKADYLAAGVEGTLIVGAAGVIAFTAIERLLSPAPVEAIGVGAMFSVAASLVNLVVARLLLAAGREHDSIALDADGRHLMTDVWTSVGVLAGVILVALTGFDVLDPIIALLLAGNILVTGVKLVRSFTDGLMDRALTTDELARIDAVLASFANDEVGFHAVLTRRAGRRAFISFHMLVPGRWPVQRGHDLIERVEADLRTAIPSTTTLSHLEPREDPISFADTDLDRDDEAPVSRLKRGEEL